MLLTPPQKSHSILIRKIILARMTFCKNFENVLEEIIDVFANLTVLKLKSLDTRNSKIILKDSCCKFNDEHKLKLVSCDYL